MVWSEDTWLAHPLGTGFGDLTHTKWCWVPRDDPLQWNSLSIYAYLLYVCLSGLPTLEFTPDIWEMKLLSYVWLGVIYYLCNYLSALAQGQKLQACVFHSSPPNTGAALVSINSCITVSEISMWPFSWGLKWSSSTLLHLLKNGGHYTGASLI